jgi:hypothetical protein
MSADSTTRGVALTAGGRTRGQWQEWLDTYHPEGSPSREALQTAINYAFHYVEGCAGRPAMEPQR